VQMKAPANRIVSIEDAYLTYYPKLVRFAVSYVVRRHEAENIVQNIFLGLLEKEHDPRNIADLNAYLFTAVKNRCVDFLRSEVRLGHKKHSLEDVRELSLKLISLEQFAESSLSFEELERTIRNAVDALPERCREIFIMSRVEGMMHAQIASRLGISASTVNNQIVTALRKLKEELSEFLVVCVVITAGKFVLFM